MAKKRCIATCRCWGVLLGLVVPALAMGSVHAAVPEISPYLGMGQPSGDGTESYDPGLVAGLSIGARVSPLLSLQAHLEYDRLNLSSLPPPIQEGSGWVGHVGFSPSFHLVLDEIDLSISPTFGFWRLSSEATALNVSSSFTARGMELGVRAAVLIVVSPTVAVGPQISYVRMWATKVCSQSGPAEICDGSPDNDDEGFWTVAAAARF